MEYLVAQFGESNEPIDNDLLEDILEELSTMKEQVYELSLISIELGKPQILEYLLENNEFNYDQIRNFKKHVEDYVEQEEREDIDPEEIEEITSQFEEIISNVENPRKRNWAA